MREKRLCSLLGGQAGLCDALCLKLYSDVHGPLLFRMLLHTVKVCFICNCRAAFLPIPTLTATAWDPTIFRYLWTVPSELEWPATNVTAPCACWTIRVGLGLWLTPRVWRALLGRAREAPPAQGSPGWPRHLLLCGGPAAAPANLLFVAQQWRFKLPEDSPYLNLFYMFYGEFPPQILLAVHLWKAGRKVFPHWLL